MEIRRLRIFIQGTVQGVGFRPFVYRLATELNLKGWVNNSPQGVTIEVEGAQRPLNTFLIRLQQEKPPRASIYSLEPTYLDPQFYTDFQIKESETAGEKTTLMLPDIATCEDCLREVFDPSNRRYLYPFTNCTNCGPRFTIIEALPYDRPNTTMKIFEMCDACKEEYENPNDRRFHAQPNACPTCGPHVELWSPTAEVLATHQAAIEKTVDLILSGKIVAVKGLGGFHLMVDARNIQAVQRLRIAKNREEKPFALMYPSLQLIEAHCHVSPLEKRLLRSPESPIVLLKKKEATGDSSLLPAQNIAPHNPYLGIMLPYTPLHHILMKLLNIPIVATSGNISDEPICTDNSEALKRLKGIADYFLVHNRPIARHVDDSIVRIVQGRELVYRRARGYAPLPIWMKKKLPPILGVGAHLKNTIALSNGNRIFISQHIGDLETEAAFSTFRRTINDFLNQYQIKPRAIACDLHPDYLSTQYARSQKEPLFSIQHHYAHILACMAENELEEEVLGVSWDGTGYGLDSTIWGGEFLKITSSGFERVAYFDPFPLPGGEKAIKEPRRTALGILFKVFGEETLQYKDFLPIKEFTPQELQILLKMIRQKLNAPLTSSVGRLFDAVASLVGLRQIIRHEGQAAMELEFRLPNSSSRDFYQLQYLAQSSPKARFPIIIKYDQMIQEICQAVQQGKGISEISLTFHNSLVESIVTIAREIQLPKVVLSGGCFQNKYLTEQAVTRLREEGFQPYWHQRIPPNDGGISLGQIIGASREMT